jgi:hypothetical protein
MQVSGMSMISDAFQADDLVKRLRYWEGDGHPHGLLHREAADRIETLHMQLTATLAGTYNVAPNATANMCGRLDESGALLTSVKEMAASLHSIRPVPQADQPQGGTK